MELENEPNELNINSEPKQAALEVDQVMECCDRISAEMAKVIIGNEEHIRLMLAAMLCGGHVLLEGVPGIAKTLNAKTLARTVQAEFSRIQFTPDLMPADILGGSIFNMKTSEFNFRKGPIFANIILIDEINRSPAKTQSALLEVMEEKQATIEGETHQMTDPFFVIATQNPIEQEGTYRLPEAQLDRFLFKLKLDFPDYHQELEILKRFKSDFKQKIDVQAVCTPVQLKACMHIIEKVHISDDLLGYIARIVQDTRVNGDLFLGASPRASLAIMRTSKAIAAMDGRSFVTPDDIRTVTFPVLNHRVILSPEREMEGVTTEEVILAIVQKIEVPR